MATAALTGGRDLVPTGNSPEMSRRQIFASAARAGLVVGAAALAPAAVAGPSIAPHPQALKAAQDRAEVNARFWTLHWEWKAIVKAWEADEDDSNETWERWAAIESDAEDAMLLAPVSCASAILAKITAVEDPGLRILPAPAGTALQMIKWDLERIANLQLLGTIAR